jgi:hypothetical protein
MPLTRPAEISDKVSLSDKVGGAVRAFVTEDSAVDTSLTGGVDEFAPHEEGVASPGAQDDFLPRSGKELSSASVFVVICGVMSFIELQTGPVAIFGDPPKGLGSAVLVNVIKFRLGIGCAGLMAWHQPNLLPSPVKVYSLARMASSTTSSEDRYSYSSSNCR